MQMTTQRYALSILVEFASSSFQLGASHKNFIAVQNANNARDIQSKIREDPLLAIKQQEQAAYQSLMSNPLRLREMQERNGIKPKKDKHERQKKKEERKKLKAERKHRRERDSRSLSPRGCRHSRSPYNRQRLPSPYIRHSRSRDRSYHRLPRYDSYGYTPESRRRSYSRSPIRDGRGRERERNVDSSRGRHQSVSPRNNNGRSLNPQETDDHHFHSNQHRADRSPPPQPPVLLPPCQSSPPERDVKALTETRTARLAAMASNATSMQSERKQRLAELLEKEKAELAKEELERAKSAKSGGIGGFMSSDYKKVYGEGGLEDRIRRTRGTLVID